MEFGFIGELFKLKNVGMSITICFSLATYYAAGCGGAGAPHGVMLSAAQSLSISGHAGFGGGMLGI